MPLGIYIILAPYFSVSSSLRRESDAYLHIIDMKIKLVYVKQ